MRKHAPGGRARQGAVAVGVGLLIWMLAHTFTHLLWDQLHHDSEPTAPVEGMVTAIGVAGLSFALAAMSLVRRREDAARTRPALCGLELGLLGPIAFVAAEFLAHLGTSHGAPPVALLVVGATVHAAVGLCAPAVMSTVMTRARVAARALAAGFAVADRSGWVLPAGPARSWSTTFDRARRESRGPPAGRFFAVLPQWQLDCAPAAA